MLFQIYSNLFCHKKCSKENLELRAESQYRLRITDLYILKSRYFMVTFSKNKQTKLSLMITGTSFFSGSNSA